MSIWFIYVDYGHASGILDHSDLYIPFIYNSFPSQREICLTPKTCLRSHFHTLLKIKIAVIRLTASDYSPRLHVTYILLLTHEAGSTPEVIFIFNIDTI